MSDFVPSQRELRWLIGRLCSSETKLRALASDEFKSAQIPVGHNRDDIITAIFERYSEEDVWKFLRVRFGERHVSAILDFHTKIRLLFGDFSPVQFSTLVQDKSPAPRDIDELFIQSKSDKELINRITRLVDARKLQLSDSQRSIYTELFNLTQLPIMPRIILGRPDLSLSWLRSRLKFVIAVIVVGVAILLLSCLRVCTRRERPSLPLLPSTVDLGSQSVPIPIQKSPPAPIPPDTKPPQVPAPRPGVRSCATLRTACRNGSESMCAEVAMRCRSTAVPTTSKSDPTVKSEPTVADPETERIRRISTALAEMVKKAQQDPLVISNLKNFPKLFAETADIARKSKSKVSRILCGDVITQFDGYMAKDPLETKQGRIDQACEILPRIQDIDFSTLLDACGGEGYYYQRYKKQLRERCKEYVPYGTSR